MPVGMPMPMRDKQIMEKLFDLKKLSSSEIAFVLGCSVQVVQKRKREYEAKGTITAIKEMSWQKIKPEHREVGHPFPWRICALHRAQRRTDTPQICR
jgi:DNA-binding Lrp family transcriptional regulator